MEKQHGHKTAARHLTKDQLAKIRESLAIVEQLQGFAAPLHVWEERLFPGRMLRYDPAWLDQLCLSGELCWVRGRADGEQGAAATRSTPIVFVFRDSLPTWTSLGAGAASPGRTLDAHSELVR